MGLFAESGALPAAEGDDDLRRTTGYIVADGDPEQHEEREQTGQRPRLVAGVDRYREARYREAQCRCARRCRAARCVTWALTTSRLRSQTRRATAGPRPGIRRLP